MAERGWTRGDGERNGTGFRGGVGNPPTPPRFYEGGGWGLLRLLVGLAYGELGALEGAFALFK